MDYIIILTTFPNKDEASKVAQCLLEARAVACANIIDTISSRFWWQGKIDNASETLLIAKTEKTYFSRVESIIKKHHSYDVPEIIALPILDGSKDYLDWISESIEKK
ncbi:MAG: divalent-cation tolerance protein CutA [Candidatus Omnitrophica bacterium]|nr:divalent-cation tolerance protein CutA [Candidatus Omnitrophota bacterium]